MSHKSVPGDGTFGCGIKGGGIYGAHHVTTAKKGRETPNQPVKILEALKNTAAVASK